MAADHDIDSSLLDALRESSVVVADTSDLDAIRKRREECDDLGTICDCLGPLAIREFRPRDATTNPTLVLQAVRAQKDWMKDILEASKAFISSQEEKKQDGSNDGESGTIDSYENLIDTIVVELGCRILDLIEGRVSTEVDARLSFDTEATLSKARRLIHLYEIKGISRTRVLIKIAGTWEGIQAAKQLEEQGIHTNITLMFSPIQAVLAIQSQVTLISPFVGRILDWYKKNGLDTESIDPGVKRVREILTFAAAYAAKHNCKAAGMARVVPCCGPEQKIEVMAASFRNLNQILSLAGADLLTIAPKFLEELRTSSGAETKLPEPYKFNAEEQLDSELSNYLDVQISEPDFRYQLNRDPMATEKLAEGIRLFSQDMLTLYQLLQESKLI